MSSGDLVSCQLSYRTLSYSPLQPYCRMSCGNGCSFVGIGMEVYQGHNSSKIKMEKTKERSVKTMSTSQENTSSRLLLLSFITEPIYLINPETNSNDADEETTTQAYGTNTLALYYVPCDT